MNKHLSILAVFALLFSCTPQEDSNSNENELSGDGIIHVKGISLDRPSATIVEGEFITLVATVTPDNAANKTITWSSSSDGVATVDNSGNVTGIKAGSATITATTEDGGKKASCMVTVEKNNAPSITIGVKQITAVSAVLMGKANLGTSAAPDLMIGFQYSTTVGMLPSNSTIVEAKEADADYNYSFSVIGLEPDIDYYYRSFVLENGMYTYGETKTFKTKEASSLIQTYGASNISAIGAELKGSLDLTDVPFSEYSVSFEYNTSGDFDEFNTTSFKRIKANIDDEGISAYLIGIQSSFQYYYRAVVVFDSEYSIFGDVMTFTTKDISTLIATYDAADITNTSAKLSGYIDLTDIKIDDISEYGFAWNYSENLNNGYMLQSDNLTGNEYSSTLTPLYCERKYYYAAYVKARTHIYLADVKSFTTAPLIKDITLDKNTLYLPIGETYTLIPSITPEDAFDKSISWTSSDDNVASVDEGGKVTAKSQGKASIKASSNDGSGVFAECSVMVTIIPGAVDLGIVMARADGTTYNLYWAKSNLSVNGLCANPEDYGDYYAWGETAPYYSSLDPLTWKDGKSAGYDWASYKWCNGALDKLTRYCPENKANYWYGADTPDNKTEFADYNYADDAARATLHGMWRMPTDAEWTALRDNCTWTWTTENDVKGQRVTGPNGNSIFLPAAGYRLNTNFDHAGIYGDYWSSSLLKGYPYRAKFVSLHSKGVDVSNLDRRYGFSVRPVYEDENTGSGGGLVNYYGCKMSSSTVSSTAHVDINIYGTNVLEQSTGWGISTLKKTWASATCYVNGTSYNLEATDGASFTYSNSQYGTFYWTWAFKNTTVMSALMNASTTHPVTIKMTDIKGNEYSFDYSEPQTTNSSFYKY